MRIFWSAIGLLILGALVAWFVTRQAWLGWAVLLLLLLGGGVPIAAFLLRGGAPDDHFPWE